MVKKALVALAILSTLYFASACGGESTMEPSPIPQGCIKWVPVNDSGKLIGETVWGEGCYK